MKPGGSWLPNCLNVFTILLTLAFAAQRDVDIDELNETLFPIHRQPFARQDRWTLLTGAEREAWTFAHEEIPSQRALGDVLPIVEQVKKQKLSLLVTLKIVAPPSAKVNHDKVHRYVKLMRAKGHHTDIDFRILMARPELYSLVKSVSGADAEKQISAALQNDASSAGIMDILYLVLTADGDSGPLERLVSHPPFVAGDRVSWIVHSFEEDHDVDVAKMLVKAEASAQKLYAPAPKFFPVPVSPVLRIVILSYTPGYEQEAPWITTFPWDSFEKTIRKMALVGQTVGFFVNPSNKECWKCDDVFQNVAKTNLVSIPRTLNLWKIAQKESSNIDIDENDILETDPKSVSKIFILVVDASKAKDTASLNRFEKSGIGSIQGASVVVIRSSKSNIATRLQSLLIQAVAESAFGISNPGRYIQRDESLLSNVEEPASRASLLLSDIALRNAVASSVHNKLSEFGAILQDMNRFDVDPTKVLTDNEYTAVTQRANLLLYKVKQAHQALSEERDNGKALHLAAAGYHDIKAIQATFHLQSSKKTAISEHFRDPRSKCHFSKIQERAISASGLFEDQDSMLSRLGFVGITFIVGFMLGRTVSLIRGQVKHGEKRE